jgi:hypothetical protein
MKIRDLTDAEQELVTALAQRVQLHQDQAQHHQEQRAIFESLLRGTLKVIDPQAETVNLDDMAIYGADLPDD